MEEIAAELDCFGWRFNLVFVSGLGFRFSDNKVTVFLTERFPFIKVSVFSGGKILRRRRQKMCSLLSLRSD